jgi:YD repeat-containing protein
VQTREDVKGVVTWSYVDGLGREIREERQDTDFGLTKRARKAPRTSFTVVFDALGNKVEEVEYDWLERKDLKLVTHYEYDGWGQQCCVIGPDGVRVHEQIDQQGSPQWRNGPVVTQYRESADGNTLTGKTVSWLNKFGEPARVERFYADGKLYSVHQTFHDGLGRLAREIDARGEEEAFARDAFDRLVDHTLANGAVVHRDYAPHSSEDLPTLIKVIHQDGKTESVLGHQAFDGLDRMIVSITGGRRRAMKYEHGQRQPKFVTTPKNHTIEYEYAPPLGEEPLGRRLVDANVNARYEYDLQNARLTACSEQPEVEGRALDPAQFQGLAREYFSNGELKSETRTLGQEDPFEMSYVHSLRGRLLAYTDVLGQLQAYEHDDQGRLVFTSLGTTSSRFEYDDLGRTRCFTTVEGDEVTGQRLTTELEYDDFEREKLRRFIFTDAIQELEQAYSVVDAIERKTLTEIGAKPEENVLLREEHFEYDTRARLEYYTSDGPLSPVDPHDVVIEAQEFYLDDIDNIEEVRTWHADGRIDAIYAFDNPEDPAQLTGMVVTTLRGEKLINADGRWEFSAVGVETLSRQVIVLEYDPDGNLVRDEAGRFLSYDPLGRLVSVELPGSGEVGSYGYDPLDRLAGQSIA